MSSRADLRIDPGPFKSHLSGLRLPYTVETTKPFKLGARVREIECTYGNPKDSPPSFVGTSDQVKHWRDALEDARTGRLRGQTMVISGPGSISYPELVAATLAGEYLYHNRSVAWVNVTASLSGQRDLEELSVMSGGIGRLDALFITGIRWDGDRVRFDKAYDLLRQTHRDTDRIVVGAGADPLALSRKIDMSVNRVIQVAEARFIQM